MIKIINVNNRIEGKITLSDEYTEQEINVEGRVTSVEMTTDSLNGIKTTTVTFVEDLPYRIYSPTHIMGRCEIDPSLTSEEINRIVTNNLNKSLNKKPKSESMTVKIKKQPKEISLEELKQGEEYESVRIYIDEEKKEKIEKQYGVTFGFSEIIAVCQSEIEFKDNYMFLEMDYGYKNVPYEFIEKIEVVEK